MSRIWVLFAKTGYRMNNLYTRTCPANFSLVPGKSGAAIHLQVFATALGILAVLLMLLRCRTGRVSCRCVCVYVRARVRVWAV